MVRPLRFGADRELRLLQEADAEELHSLIEANREHLGSWLPWAPNQRYSDTLQFIRHSRRLAAHNNGLQTGVVAGGRIVGIAGFHAVDWSNRTSSIGYWLAADEQGRGIMTAAVTELCRHGFVVWKLNRIELRIAPGNRRSRAIADRLGFVYEGTLRNAEILNGRPHDLLLHSLLIEEWKQRATRRRGSESGVPARG